MDSFLVPGVMIVTFLVYILNYVFFGTNRGLKDVPGPFWAKLTNLQRVLYVKSGRSHEIHQKSHEKHGDLVRLGPNMVSISNPEAVPVVYPMRPGFRKVGNCQAVLRLLRTVIQSH